MISKMVSWMGSERKKERERAGEGGVERARAGAAGGKTKIFKIVSYR
jgi:hypothetical protein